MNLPEPDVECASFWRRAVAYWIDCTFAFLAFAIIQVGILLPLRSVFGITNSWFHSGLNTELYTLLTISVPVWLYFVVMESCRWRATIGKRVMGIQVVDSGSNSQISFKQAFLRTLLKLAPWELAHLGNNLPVPIWYADDPSFRIAFVLSGVLMVVYVGWVIASPGKRGLHDLFAGTVVVSAPQ